MNDEFAFPFVETKRELQVKGHGGFAGPVSVESFIYHTGLTKREYFAAMAMASLGKYLECWNLEYGEVVSKTKSLMFAKTCLKIADALIAELKKEN